MSTYSKTIDTPYSSVSKSDVRVSNPGFAKVAYPSALPAAYHGYGYPAAYHGYPAAYPAYHGAYPAVASVAKAVVPAAYPAYHGAYPAVAPVAKVAAPGGLLGNSFI